MFGQIRIETQLFRSGKRVVGGKVHVLPFSVHDFFANLGGGFTLLRFGVSEGRFLFAEHAMGAVIIAETIEQAFVTDFLVATAIARLLVEDWFDFRSERVDVLSFGV
jgi:hypothetical protein